jgi:hypothetical protein
LKETVSLRRLFRNATQPRIPERGLGASP